MVINFSSHLQRLGEPVDDAQVRIRKSSVGVSIVGGEKVKEIELSLH